MPEVALSSIRIAQGRIGGFTAAVTNAGLRTEVLQRKFRRTRIPEIRIEKAKQRWRLAANASKKQHWNVGLKAIHLCAYGGTGRIRQIVLEKNAIYPASLQQMQSLICASCGKNLVAGSFEHELQLSHVFRLIFNAKNSYIAHWELLLRL